MKTPIILLTLFVLFGNVALSQTQYKVKIETSYLPYVYRTIKIDPGPNWKGYNLNNKQHGLGLSLVNGIEIRDQIFVGIGFGYLKFEGIKGLALYSDIQYAFFKHKKLNPFLNLELGYSHLWNQYDGGTGTGYAFYGLGVRYYCNNRTALCLMSGMLFTQQSLFCPVRFSIMFAPIKNKKQTNYPPLKN